MIKYFNIRTSTVSSFLKNIVNGFNKYKAFRSVNNVFSNSTIYRIYKRLSSSQAHIRTFISSVVDIKKGSSTSIPFIRTFNDIIDHFKLNDNFISEFHLYFQTSIFS
jgi:hypothetical protein